MKSKSAQAAIAGRHSVRLLTGLVGLTVLGSVALGQTNEPAFTIGGKTTTLEAVYKEDQAAFFELEKKKYQQIEGIAKDRYLDYFWAKKAAAEGKSVAEAQKEYESKNIKISDKEAKETLERFKDHPSLKNLEPKEQNEQIRDYLYERARRDLYNGIVEAGLKKGELVISYPEPKEPVYQVTVRSDDHVRYGPNPDDTKPLGCKGDDCPITIVEYSEFQCPFCVRVLPDTKKVLTNYKGKVRWIVRDFPLSFHDRARPAAIAAHCAGNQDKFWQMYGALFDNQRNLGDEDLKKYAKGIGVDQKKWEKCVAESDSVEAVIDKNFQSGVSLGVTGTPAFFINGRRLSGALPFSEFERIIEEELKDEKKS